MSTGADKIQVAKFIRREAAHWRGLLDAADDLEALGSIKSASASLKAQVAALEIREAEAWTAVEAAEAKSVDVVKAANAQAASINATAKAEKERATADAAETVRKANVEADRIIAAAKASRVTIEAEIRAEVGRNVDEILKRKAG